MAASHTSYKLVYFNGKGKAEVSRLLFHATGHAFEDVRLERDDWTNNWKPKTPFKQVPVLEFDGHMLPQSRAIERYLATQFGELSAFFFSLLVNPF